jgi:NMD protein affecting ribosome stability and mRNA decay
MPEMQAPGYLACAHCGATGTCRNGSAGDSCAVCIKKNKIEGQPSTGLVCSVCQGCGAIEPRTARLRTLIAPIFALLIVYTALGLAWFFAGDEHFTEVLAFAATLIGSITGYYFGGRNKL